MRHWAPRFGMWMTNSPHRRFKNLKPGLCPKPTPTRTDIMFKELGAMMSLLKNQGKIQEEIKKFQSQVGRHYGEATAGAGYVTVKVNGKYRGS